MKIELAYPTCGAQAGGRLMRRWPKSLRVEAETEPSGAYCKQPVCGRCALAGCPGQKRRLMVRASEPRYLADQSEPACEEGIEVQIMGELQNLERRSGSTTPVDLLGFDES